MAALVLFNTALRLGLAFFNGLASLWVPRNVVPALMIGVAFDGVVARCVLAPLALLIGLLRGRGNALAWVPGIVLRPLVMVFVGTAIGCALPMDENFKRDFHINPTASTTHHVVH